MAGRRWGGGKVRGRGTRGGGGEREVHMRWIRIKVGNGYTYQTMFLQQNT